MSVLDPCLADRRQPVAANALHSFRCFQPILNAPMLRLSFISCATLGMRRDWIAILWLPKEVSKSFICTLGVAQEGWVLYLGSILALIPADYLGVAALEIRGYGLIPLLEFPSCSSSSASIYLTAST